ncbi:MAG: hypothetical protein RR497_04900 [Oscillospiraceae bacterium]
MKNRILKTIKHIYLIALLSLLFILPANAYLDPATTSYIILVIAGVAIASATFVGIFWKKICAFFRKIKLNMLGKKLARKAEKAENKVK